MTKILKKKITSSSTIDNLEFIIDTEELKIKFLSGTTYSYSKVPFKIYMNLIHAPSTGTYFWKHIRHKYKTKKMR